jgi:DNA-directed RNA polymerase subunit RPC12/RpoP
MEGKIECPNCESKIVLEQVTARGIFTREVNGEEIAINVVSWEPIHDFYECFDCGTRWIRG